MEFFSPLITVRHASQAGWDVPEANIGVLRLQTIINTVNTNTHTHTSGCFVFFNFHQTNRTWRKMKEKFLTNTKLYCELITAQLNMIVFPWITNQNWFVSCQWSILNYKDLILTFRFWWKTLTTPSNTIWYPSLFLILLYRYWDRSKHLSMCCSNPMVPCRGKKKKNSQAIITIKSI